MKTVIFDLDGVLVFTDKYHYKAWKKIADRLGIEFNETINNRLRGVSRMDSLEIILENSEKAFSKTEKEALADEKNADYCVLLNEMAPADLDPATKQTLDELRRRGYTLAIGSSSRNTPLILEKVGLAGYFDAVSDGNNITHSKPDPEVFIKAAGFAGAKPEECYVVEDAFAGIDAAKAAGMQAIAIGDAVKSDKADYRIKSFSGLLEILP